MKNLIRICAVIGAVVISTTMGCKRHPEPPMTVIPGRGGNHVGGDTNPLPPDNTTPIPTTPVVSGTDNITALGDRNLIEGMVPDREAFKASTVYFEFDHASLKNSEMSKIEAVSNALKSKPDTKLQVEGHCDERGTDEYNRSLGERRALAVREFLINSGISGDRVFTISYGEDKPVDTGHNDAAWSKNRRADFILLLPKP